MLSEHSGWIISALGDAGRHQRNVSRTSRDLAAGGQKAVVLAATCQPQHKSKERPSVYFGRGRETKGDLCGAGGDTTAGFIFSGY